MVTGMDDLITFLRVQLDDDERVASTIRHGGYLPPIWHAKVHTDGSADLYAEERINHPPDAESEFDPEPFAHVRADRVQHEHIVRWDPAHVLAEIDAKRRILDEIVHEATGLDMSVDLDRRVGTRDTDAEPYLGDQLLRLLALPYAGRDGYREEWRP